MRKILCLLFAACLMCSTAFAEGINLAELSIEQLYQLQEDVSNEIASRIQDTASRKSLVQGTYVCGKNINPGAYTITLTGYEYSAVVAVFENQEDCNKYMGWDSTNNLKEYGKIAVYAQADVPVYISIKEGEILYIGKGEGIAEPFNGTYTKGIYLVGEDVPTGEYIGVLNDLEYSAVVAVFESAENLMSYITWDSANNLKEYSVSFLYARPGEKFHVDLTEGSYLYIGAGNGTLTLE